MSKDSILPKYQELKNKFIIYKLVKNHFSLTKESLNLFKFRLFYEPIVANEYREIIGNEKDLRKRIKLPFSLYEDMDEGWLLFCETFRTFCYKNSVKFEDYRRNKICINKQDVKLKKVIEKFYLENPNYISDLNYLGETPFGLIKTSKIKEEIKQRILKALELIGTKKIPDRGLELVFSLNFADWFLCSSAEKWNSCISLNSSYENAYWSGLPGIICDKNRAMVYITDGKKKNYNGIIVDHIISRSWVMLIRSRDHDTKNKTFLTIVREYPMNIGLKKIVEKTFNMKFFKPHADFPQSFVGRYYFELLWHYTKEENKEYMNSIYFDTTNLHIAKNNIAKFFKKGSYGFYKGPGGGASEFSRIRNSVKSSDLGLYYDGGLDRLIHGTVKDNKLRNKVLKEIANFFGETDFQFDENDGYEEEENY
jgi:hypothetical protein